MKRSTRNLIERLKACRKPEKARNVFWSGDRPFVHYTVWSCPRCGEGDFDMDTPYGAYIVDCPACGEHVICGPHHIDDCGEALVVAGERKLADQNGTFRCTHCAAYLDRCDCGAAGCTFCPPGALSVAQERVR